MTKLDDYGFIQSRPKGEYHANNQVRRAVLCHAVLRCATLRFAAAFKGQAEQRAGLHVAWLARGRLQLCI